MKWNQLRADPKEYIVSAIDIIKEWNVGKAIFKKKGMLTTVRY